VNAPTHRKLIEVALPLEAINRESAREKSIRHGHPSTLHLWWSRKPLATVRAVLFAQLVDDPSSHPDRFPTAESQALERRRLFDLIERLVVWENMGDDALLRQAGEEIAACFDGTPPAVLDPFAGGGSIPLEAQRLGLEAHASDLNPVATLINKALIEIPPQWADRPPVFPDAAGSKLGQWSRAAGLAEDVRRYGQWMRDQAEDRIGAVYPPAILHDGTEAKVVAWKWARVVTCPNPACRAAMPLLNSFWLSKNKERPAWLQPVIDGKEVRFNIVENRIGPKIEGTVGRQGAVCLVCNTPVPLQYVRLEGQAGRMSEQMLAIIADGHRRRVYLPATVDQIAAAKTGRPVDLPEADLPDQALGFRIQVYGMLKWVDLFTDRQLVALSTFSDLVAEARTRVAADGRVAGLGASDADSYAGAVSVYLAFAVSNSADDLSTMVTWRSSHGSGATRSTFARQALPMTWDFAEANPFANATADLATVTKGVAHALSRLSTHPPGFAVGDDVRTLRPVTAVISTDPPYYDNIGYADLSDYFYIWLRRSLLAVYPELLGTLLTPKRDELIASPFRFDGDRTRADRYFEDGFVQAFTRLREFSPPDIPLTVFYAFKQTETGEAGLASTGWETMLNGLRDAGLMVTATWPMRTERSGRSTGIGANALASSIVLVCRPRPDNAEAITRRSLLNALHTELPKALREMQQGSIAPVDLAQAAIGPGMAVFTRYGTVLEADGSSMTVRTALALINHVLDEVLSEQEGDFDADTRFCVKWFSQFGWDEQPFGRADELSRSTNTSVDGLIRGGIFWARAGKARLVSIDELSENWDPMLDERISVWEVVVRLAAALESEGGTAAARLMASAGQRVDLDAAKELAYLLYSVCEKRGWTPSALLFNGLGTSWSDLSAATSVGGARTPAPAQGALTFTTDEE
jgi:putative DNA methylase